MAMDKKDDVKIRRFSNYRILEHWVHMLTFVVLAITGLSQKFYSLDVSSWFIMHLGGIDSVRLIHRYTGIIFLGVVLAHIIIAMIGITVKKWTPSMLISKKDFKDVTHNIKYYLGMEDHPAICDRYSYRQKFEYWGVLIGAVIITFSGLALWFPVFITQFLPGEFIPAAKVLHTNQAILIFIMIALWHIYNSIFNPEVFPLDTSIFTGYISRERMEREHPAELMKMEGNPLKKIIGVYQEPKDNKPAVMSNE
jgi:formate dehydrogenase gamma subunit